MGNNPSGSANKPLGSVNWDPEGVFARAAAAPARDVYVVAASASYIRRCGDRRFLVRVTELDDPAPRLVGVDVFEIESPALFLSASGGLEEGRRLTPVLADTWGIPTSVEGEIELLRWVDQRIGSFVSSR